MNCCCICGPVKNCGPYLDKVFENIEQFGSLFDDYVIIVYYDKSDDNTLQFLQQYKQKNRRLQFFVNLKPLSSFRTHNIANARNYILQCIKINYSNFSYFIMMDFDDICARDFNKEVFINCLKRDDWDSLSFDHPTGYYDFWALSKRPYVLSCHHLKNKIKGWEYITDLIQQYDKNALIPCLSAFNGFAIYKTDKFINCYYDGRYRTDYIPKNLINESIEHSGGLDETTQQHEDCEHRHFHIQAVLQNNARIRICPLQLFL